MIAYWFNRLADVLDEHAGMVQHRIERGMADREQGAVVAVFGALAVVLRKVGGEER